MVGVIDGFRWCILGGATARSTGRGSLISLASSAFMLWFGISGFRRTERDFADLI